MDGLTADDGAPIIAPLRLTNSLILLQSEKQLRQHRRRATRDLTHSRTGQAGVVLRNLKNLRNFQRPMWRISGFCSYWLVTPAGDQNLYNNAVLL